MDEFAEVRVDLLRTYMWHWAIAGVRQCSRALSADAGDNSARLFDAMMAVQAVRNSVRAAKKLHELTDKHWFPGQTLQYFDDEHGAIKTVRDILEHFDAYITGNGRLQHRQGGGEPFRVRFDKASGRLQLTLSDDQIFDIDLKKLQNDIALMVIDLTVDLDALEDEPGLFTDGQDELDGETDDIDDY